MLLSIKQLEVKEIRFDETFRPVRSIFPVPRLRKPLPSCCGSGRILAHTGGEVRIKGRMTTTVEALCDRCLGPAAYPY